MFHHQIGAPIIIDGKTFVQTEKDQPGLAFYSAPAFYAPGTYSVAFRVLPDDDEASEAICGFADIISGNGTIIVERTNLYLNRLHRSGGLVLLHFALAETAELQFRVYSWGKARLTVATDVVALPIPQKGHCPVFGPDVCVHDQFFCDNIPQFRNIYENGTELEITTNGVVVTCGDLSFYVRAQEDFQILSEIFFLNDYNCDVGRSTLAIDVGMNVGLASLHMASNPRVIEVHGFEPFRAPFERALENIDLNPKFAAKITPYNVGLSDADDERTVLSYENSSIATTIKGLQYGEPETIKIRNAAPIFQQLIDRANNRNLEVMAKIDCEGSEFAIIAALASSSLLRDVRVLMIEWHKVWSADKSQKDIVAPLIENDFVIVDRTMPANPHAGMIYAVRSARGKARKRWWKSAG